MRIIKYPKREQWAEIVERPRLDLTKLNATVSSVLADVRQRGDAAVKEYEEKFDKAILTSLAVTEQEMDEAEQAISNELKDAIILAHHNIKVFHISQRFVGQKLAEECCHRKGRTLHSRRHGTTFLYRPDACDSCQDRWL